MVHEHSNIKKHIQFSIHAFKKGESRGVCGRRYKLLLISHLSEANRE